MDIVTYAAAVKRAKRIADATVRNYTTDQIAPGEERPVASDAVYQELDHINDMIVQVMEYIGIVTDKLALVTGVSNGSTGTASLNYSQIARLVAGENIPLGTFVIGDTLLNEDGVPKFVFLALSQENESGLYRDRIHLGALYKLDTEQEKAYFAVGENTAVIDAAGNITLIER